MEQPTAKKQKNQEGGMILFSNAAAKDCEEDGNQPPQEFTKEANVPELFVDVPSEVCSVVHQNAATRPEDDEKVKNTDERIVRGGVCKIVIPNSVVGDPSVDVDHSYSEPEKSSLTIKEGLEWGKENLSLRKYLVFCFELCLEKADNMVFTLLWNLMSVLQMFFGLLYLADCSAEHWIPVYLFLAGMFGFICSSISLALKFSKTSKFCRAKSYGNFTNLISATKWVLFFWFLLGCYWVYHIFPMDEMKNFTQVNCNLILYWYSFFIINLCLLLTVAMLVAFISFMYYYKVKHLPTEPNKENDAN